LSLINRIDGRHGHLDNKAAAAALENLLGDRSQLLLLAHRSAECNTEELVQNGIAEALARLQKRDLPFAVLSQENSIHVCRGTDGCFAIREIG
jgi:hypothetical protein